jgi:hypothetical protein
MKGWKTKAMLLDRFSRKLHILNKILTALVNDNKGCTWKDIRKGLDQDNESNFVSHLATHCEKYSS